MPEPHLPARFGWNHSSPFGVTYPESRTDSTVQLGRSNMGSTPDKVAGKANEVAGKVKKNVGEATGNNELRAKGAAQETKGKVQSSVGKAKDAVKGAVDRM